jgi:hypothetical protein
MKNWKVSVIEIGIEEIAKKWNVSVDEAKVLITNANQNSEKRYPMIVQYEFFDENDNLLPNQPFYRKLLSFKLDSSMRLNVRGSFEQVKNYVKSSEERSNEIANRIKETTKGEYQLIDFCANYESRGSYFIIYFQYKIKQTNV